MTTLLFLAMMCLVPVLTGGLKVLAEEKLLTTWAADFLAAMVFVAAVAVPLLWAVNHSPLTK